MEMLPFGTKLGEVETHFRDLRCDETYRVWAKPGSCILSFESKLSTIESEKIAPSDEGKIAPFHLFKFENGVSILSRNVWGVLFYRKEQP